jgi:hypothetical protein
MIGQAAEIADGIVLWARPSSYIRDVVVPEITEVRRAAGLDLTGFGVLAAVPAAMFDAAAYRDDVTAFDAATASPSRAISERFVLDLCAIGDPQTISEVLSPVSAGRGRQSDDYANPR